MRIPEQNPRAGADDAVPAPTSTAAAVAELDDDELEQVVGGLERIYLPVAIIAAED